MKERPLKFWCFSWSTHHYLTHPWTFIADIFRNIKNAFHRTRYGYGYIDLWNTNNYLLELTSNMLDVLADTSHTWPGEGTDWPNPESWAAELHVIAHLMRLLNDEDRDYNVYLNGTALEPIHHLPCINKYVLTDSEEADIEAADNKYIREAIITKALRAKVFARMAEIYGTLWD